VFCLQDVDAKEKARALHRVRCAAWAFPRCLASRLSGPEDERPLQLALETRLDDVSARRLLRAPNRPLQALMDLSQAMNALPIDEKRRVEMDKSVILLGDALETCERIFTSPVPLVYTRHTARFLSCWLVSFFLSSYGQLV
jgi:predicted membrane chloride channel (bestrophin family)